MSETASNYIERVQKYMDSLNINMWVDIDRVSKTPQRFSDAVKFLISLLGKPYEFSNDYTKVRRIENVDYSQYRKKP